MSAWEKKKKAHYFGVSSPWGDAPSPCLRKRTILLLLDEIETRQSQAEIDSSKIEPVFHCLDGRTLAPHAHVRRRTAHLSHVQVEFANVYQLRSNQQIDCLHVEFYFLARI